jgi:hypothetical protein
MVGTELSKEERLKVTCGIRVIAKKDRVRFLKKIPLITTFETGLLSTAKEEVISSEEPVGGPNNYYKPDLSAPNNLCNVDVRST